MALGHEPALAADSVAQLDEFRDIDRVDLAGIDMDDDGARVAAIDELVVRLLAIKEDGLDDPRVREKFQGSVDRGFGDIVPLIEELFEQFVRVEDAVVLDDGVEDPGPLGGVFGALGLELAAEDSTQGLDDLDGWVGLVGHGPLYDAFGPGAGWGEWWGRGGGSDGDTLVPMADRPSRTPTVLAALLAAVVSVVFVLVIGDGTDPVDGLAWVLASVFYAGGPAALFLGAALGYGKMLGRLLLKEEQGSLRGPVEAAMGLGFMLALSHGLGALGVWAPMLGIGIAAVGVAIIVRPMLRVGGGRTPGSASRGAGLGGAAVWVAVPAVAVLVVAASNAPGRLWDSEFGGYDALSYHLPIVQEWIASGRIEPLEHNVYSYLPSFVESAFYFIAMMTESPGPSGTGQPWGLLADDGWRVLSAQWLHAGITVLAAWIVAGAAGAFGERAGLDAMQRRIGAGVAGALVLATPWVVVVGSLAYNEMAVVALGAGAMAACLLGSVRPMVRGAIVGGLIGIACGAKPTALFMLGPPIGILMLAMAPRKVWGGLVVGGVIAGALMLGPWMIRNAAHGGNPVFPYATGIFGTAHWTGEQAARFASAHHFDGTLLDRIRTALWVNPQAGPGARTVEKFRGVTNPQWGLLFLATVAAASMGIFRRRGQEKAGLQRVAMFLAIGLGLQLFAWVSLTHIQSRFLLPCIVFAGPLVGLVLAGVFRVRVAAIVGAVLVAVQTGATLWIWSTQAGGQPTLGMIGGVAIHTGEPFVSELHARMPVAATNRIAQGETVYLLGGATPLYFTTPVVYHTTWDTSPLGALMRAYPDEPQRWASQLRADGVVFVLADYAELGRLREAGWYDELVTPELVMAWLDVVAEPVVGWPPYGQRLYRLLDNPGPSQKGHP